MNTAMTEAGPFAQVAETVAPVETGAPEADLAWTSFEIRISTLSIADADAEAA